MRRDFHKAISPWLSSFTGLWRTLLVSALLCASLAMFALPGYGQADMENKVQLLTDALNRAQDQLSQAQVQLQDLRRQIADLREQVSTAAESASASAEQQRLSSQVEALKENQELQASEIATHEQAKVESESKYPVKVTGMVLLNGFVNTNGVDMPATPTVALGGAGTTGASLRQTVLGLDLLGPHLFGGQSHADVRADFFGSTGSSNNGAYNAVGLLRLRTAHAALAWDNTEAWFSLDRPMVSANEPASLTAAAVPPLSWSGNLWTWNPQAGITRDFGASSAERVRIQGALIDVSDPPYAANASPAVYPASTAEQSRWPGVEARMAFGSQEGAGFRVGAGGYFAPHRTIYGGEYDSWAGTLDYRQPLPGRMQFSGNFYRGAALGGLGGGAYKDYGVRADLDDPGVFYIRSLDAAGGWAELKERATERLEFNAALGIDSVPAGELREYQAIAAPAYQNLDRTQTFTGNAIYSPSAWLLFSLEYRHLESSTLGAPAAASNIIGVAAGYKF
jgi:F0F1-type ATP synthase membrane subunit b/b'